MTSRDRAPVAGGTDSAPAQTVASSARRDDYRPEIQGLRTVAVALVVLYHLWSTAIPGGYVGVDVFFVISGFLITSHILREVSDTGRLDVLRFWARRIRRLLPASVLVLVLSGVAVIVLAPATEWSTSLRQIGASAAYVQNWALAADAVDYMAADNVPTVVQHYWSLSVEEQFYLLWPLLVVMLLALQRSLHRRDAESRGLTSARVHPEARRRTLLVGMCLLAGLSLLYSIHSTAVDQSTAYLSTLTRVWEFAAGAITALVVLRPKERVRLVLGWIGLGAILGSALVYTETSPFPGWIATVPVLGTVAVILAGADGSRSAGHWLARRPVVLLGGLSYSIYLIHWPLIVLIPYATGSGLSVEGKLLVLGLTGVLAWLSKTYVEDPLRRGPLLGSRPRSAFVFAAASVVLLVGGAAVTGAVHQAHLARAESSTAELVRQGGPCLGPAALDDPDACGGVSGAQTLVPLETLPEQAKDARLNSCQTPLDSADVRDCIVGDTSKSPTMALVGDSHAGMWLEAADALGQQSGVAVRVFVKSSCPMTSARRVLSNEKTDSRQVLCEQWRDGVLAAMSADGQIRDVVTTAFTDAYGWESVPGRKQFAAPVSDGFVAVWARWVNEGRSVHVVRDAPLPRTAVPACLAAHRGDSSACDQDRSSALAPDTQPRAVRVALSQRDLKRVHLVDLTDRFCDESTCYSQIGGIPVYRDRSHLSEEYSRLLGPYLAREIERHA